MPAVFCKLYNTGLIEAYVRLTSTAVEVLQQSRDFASSAKALVWYRPISKKVRCSITDLVLEYDKHWNAHPFFMLPW